MGFLWRDRDVRSRFIFGKDTARAARVADCAQRPKLSDPARGTPRLQPEGDGRVRCRVGAGIAPDAPHGPVREQLAHTVRQ